MINSVLNEQEDVQYQEYLKAKEVENEAIPENLRHHIRTMDANEWKQHVSANEENGLLSVQEPFDTIMNQRDTFDEFIVNQLTKDRIIELIEDDEYPFSLHNFVTTKRCEAEVAKIVIGMMDEIKFRMRQDRMNGISRRKHNFDIDAICVPIGLQSNAITRIAQDLTQNSESDVTVFSHDPMLLLAELPLELRPVRKLEYAHLSIEEAMRSKICWEPKRVFIMDDHGFTARTLRQSVINLKRLHVHVEAIFIFVNTLVKVLERDDNDNLILTDEDMKRYLKRKTHVPVYAITNELSLIRALRMRGIDEKRIKRLHKKLLKQF